MRNIQTLKDPSGNEVLIDQDESAVIEAQFFDMGGVQLDGASILVLQFSLWDEQTGVVINGRDGVDILNTDIGTVDPSGLAKIKLTPADNPVISTLCTSNEPHVAEAYWEWRDADGVDHSGRQKWRIRVAPKVLSCVQGSWIG